MGAGGGQKTLFRACCLLQKGITPFGKLSVSADVHAFHCFFYIFYFLPCIGRHIKPDHPSPPRLLYVIFLPINQKAFILKRKLIAVFFHKIPDSRKLISLLCICSQYDQRCGLIYIGKSDLRAECIQI